VHLATRVCWNAFEIVESERFFRRVSILAAEETVLVHVWDFSVFSDEVDQNILTEFHFTSSIYRAKLHVEVDENIQKRQCEKRMAPVKLEIGRVC